MRYEFNINGKIRAFWYNDIQRLDGGEGTMEELIEGQPSSEERPAVYIDCYRDENSDLYFTTSDGVKVMCKDAITKTPEEFIRHAYENIDASGIMDDMMRTLQKYGIGCIRFRMNNDALEYDGWHVDDRGRGVQQFHTQSKGFKGRGVDYKPMWLEYEAHAEFNRMPESNYKLRLYAVNNPDEHRTYDFYTSDLNRMWIVRPDYMQLTLGERGTPTGIYGKKSDSEYLRELRKKSEETEN